MIWLPRNAISMKIGNTCEGENSCCEEMDAV